MQPVIQYDQEFKNKFDNIFENKIADTIILKCKYPAYHDIILNCTSLPTVLIDLICVWIDDEITLKIQFNDMGFTYITFENTYINLINTQTEFALSYDNVYDIYFCNNILVLICDSKIDDFYKDIYARSIYTDIVSLGEKNTRDINIFYHYGEPVYIKIVNYNLLLTVCNLIHTIRKFVSQLQKN